MRVTHLITRMIVGGAQENTLLTCQDLIRLFGDQVLLVTGPAVGPEGDLLTAGRGAEVPTRVLPALTRAIHPWKDFHSYQAIRAELRAFRPEVVHTHSAKAGFLGRLAASSLGVPAIIHTVHGAPFHSFQGRGARTLFRHCEVLAARKCHALVSVADAMTDQLVAAGVAPREKFTTVYSGMDVAPFLAAETHRAAIRDALGFSEDDVVVGKVARLFHLKGHEYLIEAAASAIQAFPRLRFLLVGDGLLKGEIERRLSRLGIREHFRFTGLVDPGQIPEMISAMDILVHCSLREGLARALPQALLCGKPVISYDIDGAREVVFPEETGVLLPAKAIAPLAEAIVRLAGDPAERVRLGRRGRELCLQRFHHETMTRALRALYERVLAGAV